MIFETSKVLVPHWSSVTYEFQRQFPSWNSLVPREELFSSSGGTFQFQGRNFSFPPFETLFSSLGNVSFHKRSV